jgi:hypothetical protein
MAWAWRWGIPASRVGLKTKEFGEESWRDSQDGDEATWPRLLCCSGVKMKMLDGRNAKVQVLSIWRPSWSPGKEWQSPHKVPD